VTHDWWNIVAVLCIKYTGCIFSGTEIKLTKIEASRDEVIRLIKTTQITAEMTTIIVDQWWCKK